MKIDAHHHFWRYNAGEYGWIGDNMQAIRRDFLPADLKEVIAPLGIEGVVSVQARQTLEETRWLLELAAQNEWIKGVVGWAPLLDENVRKSLQEFAPNPHFKGVRHGLQGEAPEFMERADFNNGIACLKEFNVAYDLLITERHLPRTTDLADRHPGQTFVVDHIAKPRIVDGEIEPWRTHLRQLAKRENVWCKLSGMVTEADWHLWTSEQLRPYAETVLEAFGAHRVMFGSDWPVCLVACDYARWHEVAADFISALSSDEQALIWGQNAREAYGL
jgi:L-fuconolactonase